MYALGVIASSLVFRDRFLFQNGKQPVSLAAGTEMFFRDADESGNIDDLLSGENKIRAPTNI